METTPHLSPTIEAVYLLHPPRISKHMKSAHGAKNPLAILWLREARVIPKRPWTVQPPHQSIVSRAGWRAEPHQQDKMSLRGVTVPLRCKSGLSVHRMSSQRYFPGSRSKHLSKDGFKSASEF